MAKVFKDKINLLGVTPLVTGTKAHNQTAGWP